MRDRSRVYAVECNGPGECGETLLKKKENHKLEGREKKCR